MQLPPKQKVTAGMASLALIAGVAFVGVSRMRPDAPLRVQALSEPAATNAEPAATDKIVVDVAGEVVHRGVVTLKTGARVDDAIKAAGGLKTDADANALNLATKLHDGDQVMVPTKGLTASTLGTAPIGPLAVEPLPTAHHKPRKAASTPPSPIRHSAPPEESMAELTAELDKRAAETKPTPPPSDPQEWLLKPTSTSTPSGRTSKKAPPRMVSLNTCGEADLESLPGVGPATAKKILDYRREVGRFNSVDQLLLVRGIGPAKLEKIRPFVTL